MSFSLGDYVTVNDRLKAALEKFPDLRVAELPPKMIEAGGKLFVEVQMVVRSSRRRSRPDGRARMGRVPRHDAIHARQ
jgi:hypothetical protein